MQAGCVYVVVRNYSQLFEAFLCSSKLIVPEEFQLFSEKRFPAENVFDIYFGLTSALGMNEKTPCIAFSFYSSPLLTFTQREWRFAAYICSVTPSWMAPEQGLQIREFITMIHRFQ